MTEPAQALELVLPVLAFLVPATHWVQEPLPAADHVPTPHATKTTMRTSALHTKLVEPLVKQGQSVDSIANALLQSPVWIVLASGAVGARGRG